MKFAYYLLLAGLAPSLWVQAASIQTAEMTGVWAATGAHFRATLELRYARDLSQPVERRDGQRRALDGLWLTIHHAEQPFPASLLAQQQFFSVIDVGFDACEIIYYQAIARGPGGKRLKLILKDRRSVVRLDCLNNITKNRPSWSAFVHEVDEAADERPISVDVAIAHMDGEPDGDDAVTAWRNRRFNGAWVGLIVKQRNPLTAHMHYAFTGVDNPGPYMLDLDNAHVALQYCGHQFMEAMLEPTGVAPLCDKGISRDITYWRIVQCRSRKALKRN